MAKVKIIVPVGCRSDEGLSEPVIKRLQKADWVDEVYTLRLPTNNYVGSYEMVDSFLKEEPDVNLFIATGDRVEMTGATIAAFHSGILLGHIFAGDHSHTTVTHDDMHRFAISVYADVHFCSTPEAAHRIQMLMHTVGKPYNIYTVGSTQLDDMEVDTSLVPREKYALVLYNPPTRGDVLSSICKDLHFTTIILELLGYSSASKNPLVLWNEPNPDANRDKITNWVSGKPWTYMDGLTRPQFLGLLKHCDAFLSNSSCLKYEAPYFLGKKQIYQIGDRNRGRDDVSMLPGASDKIVEVLKNEMCDL